MHSSFTPNYQLRGTNALIGPTSTTSRGSHSSGQRLWHLTWVPELEWGLAGLSFGQQDELLLYPNQISRSGFEVTVVSWVTVVSRSGHPDLIGEPITRGYNQFKAMGDLLEGGEFFLPSPDTWSQLHSRTTSTAGSSPDLLTITEDIKLPVGLAAYKGRASQVLFCSNVELTSYLRSQPPFIEGSVVGPTISSMASLEVLLTPEKQMLLFPGLGGSLDNSWNSRRERTHELGLRVVAADPWAGIPPSDINVWNSHELEFLRSQPLRLDMDDRRNHLFRVGDGQFTMEEVNIVLSKTEALKEGSSSNNTIVVAVIIGQIVTVTQVGNENQKVDCENFKQSNSSPPDSHSPKEEISDSEDELLEVFEGVVSSNQEEAVEQVSKGSTVFNKYLSKSAKKRLKKQAKEESIRELPSIKHIRNALSEFEALSGLYPSSGKSSIFFFGVSLRIKESILQEIGCQKGSLPFVICPLDRIDRSFSSANASNKVNILISSWSFVTAAAFGSLLETKSMLAAMTVMYIISLAATAVVEPNCCYGSAGSPTDVADAVFCHWSFGCGFLSHSQIREFKSLACKRFVVLLFCRYCCSERIPAPIRGLLLITVDAVQQLAVATADFYVVLSVLKL
ncbi:hypothetical protein RHSIM_Rhsim07G0148000 [Rhododendron simsii]|uniref:Uncharacterized protein n=1 Tax=Rhododendron simsii TaxID=118357 RepID=A0A834GPT8_RHOSS|nr:hypothetical protein RHSIM_Rhsim07G0148000 [Rhododendron simsii]